MKINTKGFTLIESILAIAILMAASFALMSITKSQSKVISTSKTGFEMTSIVNEIRGILTDNTNCVETFSNISITNGATISEVLIKDDPNLIAAYEVNGGPYGNAEIDIDSFLIDTIDPQLVTTGSEFFLKIKFNRGNNSFTKHKSFKIKIITKLKNGFVQACSAIPSGDSFIWERSSNSPNNIFFKGGNVGIGTSEPVAKLDVNGPVLIKGGSDNPCDSSTKGSLAYYDSQLKFCTASGWENIVKGFIRKYSEISGTTNTLGTHAYCALSHITNVSGTNGCKVSKKSDDNTWEIEATGSATCNAICID